MGHPCTPRTPPPHPTEWDYPAHFNHEHSQEKTIPIDLIYHRIIANTNWYELTKFGETYRGHES